MAIIYEGISRRTVGGLRGKTITDDSKTFTVYQTLGDSPNDLIDVFTGTTAPSNGRAGFVKGARFGKTNSSTGGTIWSINIGTELACEFVTLGSIASGTPTAITVANEAADASCFPLFVTAATGDLGPKTNAGLTFNSTTGVLGATGFSGPITGDVTGNVTGDVTGNVTGNVTGDVTGNVTGDVTGNVTGSLTGNVTGNCSGSAGTAGTVTTAAQPSITSLGTLTILQVDNIQINGNTISSTGGTDLLITPLAGQQIILDGTIEIDAGVVTGATSITSTAFVGDLTGNASGNAGTATTLATARKIGNVDFNGSAAITPEQILPAATVANADYWVPCFANETTASQPLTNAGMKFHPSTGILTCTGFAGPLTGNVTGNCTGSSGTCSGLAGSATVLATPRAIGGVNFDGSAPITPLQVEPVDSANDNATFYLLIADGATGAQAVETDAGLTFNPSTNILTTGSVVGGFSKAPAAYDDDATPDVTGVNGVKVTATAAPLALTGFDNGVAGQIVVLTVVSTGGAITATDGANFMLAGSVNFAMSTGDTLVMYTADGTTWMELSRADNT